jgi:hypothetical protein
VHRVRGLPAQWELGPRRWDANMSSLASVDAADVRRRFEEYLGVFAACGRGETDELRPLLAYYGVPLLLSRDDAAVALTSDDELLDALRRQMDGMRADGYDRSEMLSSDFVPINRTSVLHIAEFSRRRADGTEIGRVRITYLITAGAAGRRISALLIHSQ